VWQAFADERISQDRFDVERALALILQPIRRDEEDYSAGWTGLEAGYW
jgi:hypothetical protein